MTSAYQSQRLKTHWLANRFIKWPLLVLGLFLLSGCIEQEIEQSLHQPGEYKGARDPLLDVSGTSDFTAKLEQRMNQVQTDR